MEPKPHSEPKFLRGKRFNVHAATTEREAFWEKYDSGIWEPETFDVFDRYVSKKTIAFDIGAWIGATTLYLATKSDRVIALEPDPIAFSELQQNISLNPELNNVELVPACISKTPDPQKLCISREPGDSMSSLCGSATNEGWTVASITPAVLFGRITPRQSVFVKIDIEGYEYTILPAILEALTGHDFTIFLSTHPELPLPQTLQPGKLGKITRKIRMASVNLELSKCLSSHLVFNSDGKPLMPTIAALNVLGTNSFTKNRTIIIKPRKYHG